MVVHVQLVRKLFHSNMSWSTEWWLNFLRDWPIREGILSPSVGWVMGGRLLVSVFWPIVLWWCWFCEIKFIYSTYVFLSSWFHTLTQGWHPFRENEEQYGTKIGWRIHHPQSFPKENFKWVNSLWYFKMELKLRCCSACTNLFS